MKTIEEKARAYDEVLERAKSWYTDAQIDFKKSLETLFPELKCDDEKIRKEIIKCVKNYGPSSANPQLFKNMLAWLEKQKDCIKLPNSAYTSNRDVIEFADKYSHTIWEKLMDKFKKNENYSIGCNDVSDIVLNAIINTYNWLEKQGEKTKPIEGFDNEFERQISHLIASAIDREHEYNESYVKWTANALLEYAKRELEKQGEQKPFDYDNAYIPQKDFAPIEPKFKKGDWVILTAGELSATLQIVNVDTNKKRYWFNDNSYLPIVDEECLHHWTIEDAKSGDVLACDVDEKPFIFKGLLDPNHPNCPVAYCGIDDEDYFSVSSGDNWWTDDSVKPATKEQRDFLFQKMKEAGYTFDFKNKEFKKIETEIEIPFDAKDNELQEATYYIPKGFYAEIDGDFVIIKKGEPTTWNKEDEELVKWSINNLTELKDRFGEEYGKVGKCIDWLKSLKQRIGG